MFLEIPRRRRSEISRLVYFGALTESKGVGDLLDALARVREQGEAAWELRMAGRGDDTACERRRPSWVSLGR